MELITLKNGLRIAFSQREYAHSASVCIFIGAGSRFENPENSGISHFIEHMLFKGTSEMDELEIAEKMDEMGGQLNAYTTKEYTCLYSQVLTEHLEDAVRVMSGMLLDSAISEEELETERCVILEEIDMYEDSPEELCSDLLYSGVYRGSSLAYPITGTKESVKNISRPKIIEFLRKYYVPERMTVSICGKFERDSVLRRIKECFGTLENSGFPFSGDAAEYIPAFSKRTGRFEQTQIILCGKGIPAGSPERYAAGILSSILGGGSSSRLTHRIRGQLGLAYSLGSYCVSHAGTGIFCIGAGIAHENQEKYLRETLKILRQVYDEGVTAEELRRTKEQFKSGLLIGLESSGSYAAMIGRALLVENEFTDVDNMTLNINKLTGHDLHCAARNMMDFGNWSLSVVGKPRTNIYYKDIMKDFE